MAYEVSFTIPERRLGKADIAYTVKRDGSMVGRLLVSKGAIVWIPRDREYGHKLNWETFDRVMQNQGSRVRPG